MKISVLRLGIALGVVWAFLTLLAGVANLIWPNYAVLFLELLDSIYPGYHFGQWGFGGIVVAVFYALIDGFICGVLVAWVYNLCSKCKKEETVK